MDTSKRNAMVAAIALGCWAQSSGAASPTVSAVDLALESVTPPAIAKDYDRGAALRVTGGAAFSISNANGTVTVTLGGIKNDDALLASGPIRVRVFLTLEPPRGIFGLNTIGELNLAALAPGATLAGFTQTLPLLKPPNDIYYVYIGVFEQEASCTSADGYCLDDRFSFPQRVKVLAGVFTEEPPIPGSSNAVEYYHAQFDHYFFTHDPNEISKLDAGIFQGWARSGRTFNVWGNDVGGTFEVCRFFSTAFGLKSSHFYTPLAFECAIVKGNPDWQYEGLVAFVDLPAGDGTCASGVPLYRLYNNGQGGSPNHRYTTSFAIRGYMIASGWISEGYGPPGVTACVPY